MQQYTLTGATFCCIYSIIVARPHKEMIIENIKRICNAWYINSYCAVSRGMDMLYNIVGCNRLI